MKHLMDLLLGLLKYSVMQRAAKWAAKQEKSFSFQESNVPASWQHERGNEPVKVTNNMLR